MFQLTQLFKYNRDYIDHTVIGYIKLKKYLLNINALLNYFPILLYN